MSDESPRAGPEPRDGPIELSTTEARQGNRVIWTTRVLTISTLVAAALLILLYFVFAPFPEPDMRQVSTPGSGRDAPVAIPSGEQARPRQGQ